MKIDEFNKRWVPVLRGKIYCSPACGFGCTKEQYDRAMVAAESLARRLGEGWMAKVWENGSWNYSAVNHVACIKPPFSAGGQYLCIIRTNSNITTTDLDPIKAYQKALSFLPS
ncbi:hypothetical protein NGK36_17215 [Hafnia alvei]|uniref:hypothetical protein n=1 Tax=Hafnia alvei TaxID=569 RepID=UPI002DB88BD1|nr:hypothetical protein [Hafnia alvei]MEB7891012.1 hypothetical protein [Hafnia alvei]